MMTFLPIFLVRLEIDPIVAVLGFLSVYRNR